MEMKGLSPGKMLKPEDIESYKIILNQLNLELEYELISLSGRGSPAKEVRHLLDLTVKVYPGQIFERTISNTLALKSILEFSEECEGRIVWVLSPSDLYDIIRFVIDNVEGNILKMIKMVEGRIERNKVYFLITKVDKIEEVEKEPILTENIWNYRKNINIPIDNAGRILSEEDVKNFLRNLFKERYNENIAKTVLKNINGIIDLTELTYRALEVYSLSYFTIYYLNKDIGGLLYTSAEERRNVEEVMDFFRKVKGGSVIPRL